MQILKSAVATLIGIMPGIIYYRTEMVGSSGALFLVVVGGFIGLALSSPTVSTRRVIHGAAHATPLLWPLAAVVPNPESEPEILPAEPMSADSVLQIAPRWLTKDVIMIAKQIFVDSRSELLPVLGDALLEAGCDNEALVNSCFAGRLNDETRRFLEEVLKDAQWSRP